MIQAIVKESKWLLIALFMLMVVWASCLRTKKSISAFQKFEDSSFITKKATTKVNQKDSSFSLAISAKNAVLDFNKHNLTIHFAEDNIQHSGIVQIWVDSNDITNIDAGGRTIKSISKTKTVATNNIRHHEVTATQAIKTLDSFARSDTTAVALKKLEEKFDKDVERKPNLFAGMGIIITIVLIVVAGMAAVKYRDKIKAIIEAVKFFFTKK
jgi:hypothetical protein